MFNKVRSCNLEPFQSTILV